MFHRQFGRHIARAPRQGHARAAVTVIVNEQLRVTLLCLDDEPRVPVRAQPDRRSNDPVPGGIDNWEVYRRRRR